MYLLKKFLLVSFFVVAALTGCGGGSGSGGSKSADSGPVYQWQADGQGFVKFTTSDAASCNTGFLQSISSSVETEMTTVTATLKKISGATDAPYGFIFCRQDSKNFYVLLLSLQGQYAVLADVAGTARYIVPWSFPNSAIINSGLGAANVVSVTQRSPGLFSISFNGTAETEFAESHFAGGEVGFYASVSSSDVLPADPVDVRFKFSSPVTYPRLPLGAENPGSMLLSYTPLQVSYSKSLGKSVITTANPAALHVVDLVEGTDVRVTLPAAPVALSLSPNGTLAAVLHQGAVSLVDLRLGSSRTFATTGSAADAVVTDAGIIYLVGVASSGTVTPGITVLDGKTGAVIQPSTGGAGSYGSSKGIYSNINNEILTLWGDSSAGELNSYNVNYSTNLLFPGTGSVYTGANPFAAPLWLSGDQSLLFTGAGSYFRASGLGYAGNFGVPVRSVSHSSTAQEAVILPAASEYTPYFSRFTGSSLIPAGDVSLPTIAGKQAYGIDIFHAADDSHVLLVQTGSSAPGAAGASFYLLSF